MHSFQAKHLGIYTCTFSIVCILFFSSSFSLSLSLSFFLSLSIFLSFFLSLSIFLSFSPSLFSLALFSLSPTFSANFGAINRLFRHNTVVNSFISRTCVHAFLAFSPFVQQTENACDLINPSNIRSPTLSSFLFFFKHFLIIIFFFKKKNTYPVVTRATLLRCR